MTPGYKSTEFFVSLVAVIVGAIVSSGVLPATGGWTQAIGVISAALVAMGYSYARGIVKAADAAAPAEAPKP
jgi:hypothetical protein